MDRKYYQKFKCGKWQLNFGKSKIIIYKIDNKDQKNSNFWLETQKKRTRILIMNMQFDTNMISQIKKIPKIQNIVFKYKLNRVYSIDEIALRHHYLPE